MPEILLDGLLLLDTRTFRDDRGFFRETFRLDKLEKELGRSINFCQDNESCSKKGVIRGLHFQTEPHAQAKLVRVPFGKIYDVAVDLRPQSSTFGKWQGFELSSENGLALLIPEGFAHGFCAMVDNTIVNYKVNSYYAPDAEGGLCWNDSYLGIKWPEDIVPIISDKDKLLPTWEDWLKK